MLDPIQIVFAVVIFVLTILLVVIGIEVFRILQEAKHTLKRVNNVLDDVEVISSSISGPIQKVSGIVQGFQQGAAVMHFVQRLIENHTSQRKAH